MGALSLIVSTAEFAVFGYLLALSTWLFFIAIMHLRLVKDDLHPVAKANAYVLLAIGLVLDFLLNVIIATVIFKEIPREWLLTSRLQRLKQEGTVYQRMLAYWICEHLLNQFDKGHC